MTLFIQDKYLGVRWLCYISTCLTLQTVFQNVCTVSHSQQYCVRCSTSPSVAFLVYVLYICCSTGCIVICDIVVLYLYCWWCWTFFMWLFIIYTSSLAKSLFINTLAHLKKYVILHLLLNFEFLKRIYSGHKKCVKYVISKCFHL